MRIGKLLLFVVLILYISIKTAYSQKDIFGSQLNFTIEELEKDQVNLDVIMNKKWNYDEEYFKKELTNLNVIWEKNKNEIKQEIDKNYRDSELIFSKYQVLENEKNNRINSREFLEKSRDKKEELKKSYISQNNALKKLLESIINSRKIYGIFKSEFYIKFDEMHDVTTRKLHDFGEEIAKDFAKRRFAATLYEEEILEQNGLTETARTILKNIETSNISIPHKILFEVSNNSDTVKCITLVALTMSNKEYDIRTPEDEDKSLESIGSIYTVEKSKTVELLYLKDENAIPNNNFERLKEEVSIQGEEKYDLLNDWFEEMESIIDRSVDGNQEKKWKEEIKQYIKLKDGFVNSESEINNEIIDLRNQIEQAKDDIEDFIDQICEKITVLEKLEMERTEKITKYKSITKKRIFYGSSKGSLSTGDENTLRLTLHRLLLSKVEELQDKHVNEYSKTYISEINNIASQKKFKEIIKPEVTRVCILELSKRIPNNGPAGVVVEIDYGYELELQIEEEYQRRFKATSFNKQTTHSSLDKSDKKMLFETNNQLFWKRMPISSSENKYGSPSDKISRIIEKKKKAGWRLPTVGELEQLVTFFYENEDLKPSAFDIKISKHYPYWSSEIFKGHSNSNMRKAVAFGDKSALVLEKDQTDSGYFIWVKELPKIKTIKTDCNKK